jgi:hypothetical protein
MAAGKVLLRRWDVVRVHAVEPPEESADRTPGGS